MLQIAVGSSVLTSVFQATNCVMGDQIVQIELTKQIAVSSDFYFFNCKLRFVYHVVNIVVTFQTNTIAEI